MEKPNLKVNEKRADLQGLRGLAILSVISFHFFPSHFPNGYLGVDQFFLLSGYLMQMLLSREQSGSFSLITNFYSRRFRRILPLYLFFITLSLITLYQCFPEAAIDINLKSASKALIFVSNTPKTAADDYFQMVSSATDIFTHTWSLSVEIQFYLIAPFLFILSARFERQGQKMFYAVIGMIINVLSTKFETDKAPSTDEEEQCLLIRDPEHDPQPYTQVCKTIAVLSVISITGSSTLLEESLARNLITLSTSLIILIPYQDVFLSSRPLAYLGDVSYSLYLVHWPIYAYWKLNGDSKNLFIYLLSAIILAIILHETFEKWYLQLSSTSVGALVASLFLINVLVINNSVIRQLIRNGSDKELDRAARLNSYWNKYDNELLSVPSCEYEAPETKPVGWCRHKGLSPTAPYKMAIIGNSWAANHGKLFYEECGYKARSILQGAAYACEPLYPTRDKPGCKENFTDFEERIRKEKPDYAFILTRFVTIGEPDSDDPIYQTMLQQTRKLISHVKIKLFILNVLPRLYSDKVDKIVPMLQDGQAPEEIDKCLHCFGAAFIVVVSTKDRYLSSEALILLNAIYWGCFGASLAFFGVNFIYRYLVASGSRLIKKLNSWKILNCLLIPLISGVIYAVNARVLCGPSESTTRHIKDHVKASFGLEEHEFTYLGPYFYQKQEEITTLNWEPLIGILISGGTVAVSFFTVVYFGVKCWKCIKNLMNTSESRSNQLQRQLFYALVVQTLIPVLLMHFPSSVVVVFTLIDVDIGIWSSVCSVTIAIYPAIDPLPNLFIIRNYREAIFEFFKKYKPSASTSSSSTTPPSTELRLQVSQQRSCQTTSCPNL